MRHKFSDIRWPDIAQSIVGLFFIAAAYEKSTDGFFGRGTAPLKSSLEWWLQQNWPAPGYHQFLQLLLPYSDLLAIAVISMQAFAGICLFLGIGRKYGAWVLFFVQLNIFLGTMFGGIGFLTFVGISVWLAAYYIMRENLTPWRWRILTYLIILMGVMLEYRRYWIGDPWIDAFAWQESHFATDVMGISPALKAFVIHLVETPLGPYIWASVWWLQGIALLFMFTRYRLFAGAVWLAILIGREWVWLNAVTGEGVLWVLTLFVWVVAEETWQHDHGILPLLPSAKQWQTAWQTLASAVVRYYRRINVWTVTVYGWTIGIASVFFGLVSVIILVAFVMPAAFGLQNFNQWGGMYDDHWCHVEVYSDSPHAVTGSELSFELENAGETQTKWVYTTPMHNQGTCLMWAKTRCGQQSNGGWAIRWVNAYMLETHFAGVDNICDMDLPQASRWFPHGN